MKISLANYLAHYGTPRHSGRYPWGSGEHPTSVRGSADLISAIKTLRGQGMKDADIAKGYGMKLTELRDLNTIAKAAQKQHQVDQVTKLRAKGLSTTAIAERTGIPEATVRTRLIPSQNEKADIIKTTADILRDRTNEAGVVDIGLGTAQSLNGISANKLRTAVATLKEEGYSTFPVQIDQLGTRGNKTTTMVLAKPGISYRDVVADKSMIKPLNAITEDGGRSYLGILPPLSVSSSRVAVRYKEQGGDQADGVIYIRPGVKDVSIGGRSYAQARIAVDGTHFIKGMAIYKDDLPKGVDVMFNTNKSSTGNKLDALKEMKRTKDGEIDPDNPFGSSISRQIGLLNEAGKVTKLTSAINLVNEEGDWAEWRPALASQVLSKQSPILAQKLLDQAYHQKSEALDEISSLTNPAVRMKLLDAFAGETDKSAIVLDAAAMPRQRTQVLLPVASLKPSEVYAPNFKQGETVALIRYPHGGTFEIPELTVNNRNAEGKSSIGEMAIDAIGIHPEVAKRLSGADFDGDTVLVIPQGGTAGSRLKSTAPLQKLKDFDPQSAYPAYEGMPRISVHNKNVEMGKVSNLITDMTIKGASNDKIARAVRHSMVVIDAEKHNLDWKKSAVDNGIAALKEEYQGGARKGAATLISRAGSEVRVPLRKPRRQSEGGPIDPATGKLVFREPETFTTKTGVVVTKKVASTKLAETPNAHDLSSGTKIESIYAEHSNRLKALADQARKELANTKPTPYNPSAAKTFSPEVEQLKAKLNLALRNKPLERQAQVLAASTIAMKKAANPDMTPAEERKVSAQALAEARARMGARKSSIKITPEEWSAIQAGAITHSRLKDILDNADLKTVKQLATPKATVLMTPTKSARAKAMLANGATQADVAVALGVSLSTLKRSIEG